MYRQSLMILHFQESKLNTRGNHTMPYGFHYLSRPETVFMLSR
uniref:Uncharacterized protein n=1 Tax=Triticum urartu TaxID=4572 RepID=A0A8R7V577_TRIUA